MRVETPCKPALDLPPPFRLVTLREVGDAFAHARTHAAELGAGTLVSVGRFDLAEFTVLLEPEEPLASAWRALYAGMVALVDALAAIAPPGTPIAVEWPDAIRLNGRLVGGGRLAWPDGADDAAPPPWLVFGAMIRRGFLSGSRPQGRANDRAAARISLLLARVRYAPSLARHTLPSDSTGLPRIRTE
jgi:hypothetical protein